MFFFLETIYSNDTPWVSFLEKEIEGLELSKKAQAHNLILIFNLNFIIGTGCFFSIEVTIEIFDSEDNLQLSATFSRLLQGDTKRRKLIERKFE